MNRTIATYVQAVAAVAAIAGLTFVLFDVLGLASAALLFLLPVLLVAARGEVGPGLLAAVAGAAAYNYFLLEPRFTFQVHQVDNFVSVIVLGAVAVVTSRLATRLKAREAEANARALASEEAAALSALLASGPAEIALQNGVEFIASRYGAARLLSESDLASSNAAFSSLDLSAAAWGIHNGDLTGHGTETMATAEWTFLPLSPKGRGDGAVVAVARPTDGSVRTSSELGQLRQLALLLGQCRDRANLEQARREQERLNESDHLRRTFSRRWRTIFARR